MPVDFLTEAQEKNFGRYAGEPTAAQLTKYFHLDESDHQLIHQHRGEHNKLGFAAQLCTVRFLGTFLPNPIDVPRGAAAYLAAQLGLDATAISAYMDREPTHREHVGEIKSMFGYTDFGQQPEHWRLSRWLYERAWLTAERPSVLFDLATTRLLENKILLPGVTTLARLVASIRDRASNRLWSMLSALPSVAQTKQLEHLLKVEVGTRQTMLDRLRQGPTRYSAPALVGALERLIEIRSMGIGSFDLSRLPAGRIKTMARIAAGSKAQSLERMSAQRRIATLVAFAYVFEETAQDDALNVLDLLISDLLRNSASEGKKDRMRSLKEFDAAALRLCSAFEVILDPELKDEDVRAEVLAVASLEELETALETIWSIARPPDHDYQKELMSRWSTLRRFLPAVLKTIQFQSTPAATPVLEAVEFLREIEALRKVDMDDAPREVLTKPWQKFAFTADGDLDRRAYTFCVLERLQDCLRRRDIFVTPSSRWSDPRAKLLKDEAWDSAKAQVCRTLNLEPSPDDELACLKKELHEAFLSVASNLPTNSEVRIEQEDGKDVLVLTPLEAQDESESLLQLRQETGDLLPLADLTDIILEINSRTGFAKEFTHLNESNSRIDDFDTSICAVLLAEACNIGLEPVVSPKIAALTKDRLSHVKQNYMRIDTITRANARLVEAQTKIDLAQKWGGGEVASADGLRFVVPVRTINSGPNPKYFGVGRGITFYNFASDQFTGFHGIVIPGTIRDSLYVLDGLLEQQTCLQPTEIMTDTAGYTDIIFGLFWLLGYQFSPRLADIGDARFWRVDPEADYGQLNGLARSRVNTEVISKNWEDLLRVAGSLKSGTVSASEFMRTLQASERPSNLAKALTELGRIAKTLYLLRYIDDPAYRRRILTQLNRQEGRHAVARVTFHGQRGELRQRYREGQEDQLGALGLVVNMIILWNTIYLDRALEHLREQGLRIEPEDEGRLSPLQHGHINVLGRYQFALPEAVMRGEYRPLREHDSTISILTPETIAPSGILA